MGEVIPFRKACTMTKQQNRSAPQLAALRPPEKMLLDVLRKQLREAGQEAPPELGLSHGTRVVHRSIVGRAFREASMPKADVEPLSDNTIKSRWKRATDRLRGYGIIAFAEPYFWMPVKPATQQREPGGVA